MAELQYNKEYTNKLTSPKSQSGLNYRLGPGTNYKSFGVCPYGKSWGRTTGNFYKMTDGSWYQVLLNGEKGYTWIREDVTSFTDPAQNDVTAAQSKKMIDELVYNDIVIHESLIKSANLINSIKAKGVSIKAQETQYITLLNRHARRQEKIKNSKVLKWQTGLKKGITKLVDGFKSYLLSQGIYIAGIGAIQLVPVVLAAAAGAGLAITAYFLFRPEYDESKTDLKITRELEEALSKVDPETAEIIKKQLEEQVDDAYNKGKTAGTFDGIFRIAKPIILILAGFWIAQKVIFKEK